MEDKHPEPLANADADIIAALLADGKMDEADDMFRRVVVERKLTVAEAVMFSDKVKKVRRAS